MRLFHCIPVIVSVVVLQSCTSPRPLLIHAPDKVNNPGLEKKHDLKVDISLKPQTTDQGGSPVSGSADAAFAITDHVGVIASYRGVNGRSSVYQRRTYYLGSPTTVEQYKFMLHGGRFDAGVGVFQAWKHIKLEAYTGLGLGSIHNASDYASPGYYKVSYSNLFGQVAFGIYNRNVSFSLGMRVMGVQYNAFHHSGNPYFTGSNSELFDFRDRGAVYVTPYWQMQAGGKQVKFNFQMGLDIGGMSNYPNVIYNTSQGYVTFGMAFLIPQKWLWAEPTPPSNRSALPPTATPE